MFSLSNLVFLDVETTGNQENDRLCQIAYKFHNQDFNSFEEKLFKPPLPISVEAMSIHHITNEIVKDKPVFQSSKNYLTLKDYFETKGKILVAHNAAFDAEMLNREGIVISSFIDTLRLIRHEDPYLTIGRHNLQYLRYYLDLTKGLPFQLNPHDAKGDVILLQLLFDRLYEKIRFKNEYQTENEAIEKMIELSQTPAFIGKMMFGKYKGLATLEVAKNDPQYLLWLKQQKSKDSETEKDWLYTIDVALKHVKKQG